MEMFGDEDAAYDEQFHNSRCPQQTPARIERRKVTLDEAESLVSSFRQQAPYFPFVRISADSTVPSLSRTSPFLLLAILTTASIRDPPLYHQMDHEFKRILSTKVVVEGRKSLDFIQGILVYVAWCVFCFAASSVPEANMTQGIPSMRIPKTIRLLCTSTSQSVLPVI
jgi:hypothetical protein